MMRTFTSIKKHNSLFQSLVIALAFLTLPASFVGCGNVIRRAQSPDNSLVKFSDKKSDTNFIGEITGIRGIRPEQIEGIGLVVGLEGTGSEPSPSAQKKYLLRELKSNKATENSKAALKSKNTSMVMIRGMIPPAAKKGDTIDLEVIAPPKTDTASLKYGQLLKTDLRPMAFLSRSLKMGNVMGKAKGPILVDALFESSTDDQKLLKGRILGGGVVNQERKLTLIVHADETSVGLTRSIAHAINERYSTYSASGRGDTAKPVTDRIIELEIPNEYEHNLGRFIQSIQAMAFHEKVDTKVKRMKDLDLRIGEPTTSQRAAIELEAIGEEGIPILKRAMQHPDFEVRFHVAEALAYMGHSNGINHLRLAAEQEPAFRWHALTALASLDNTSAKTALKDLFDVQSVETRYGAFRALQACSPDDRIVAGKLLADEFHFHDIPTNAAGLIHFSRTKRPEIVVFGNDRVSDEFIFVQAGLTVRAIDKERIRVIRFDPIDGETELTCSTRISELVKTMSRFGLDYTTLLEMFREADSNDTLNSRLVINAAPRIGSKSMEDSVSQDDEQRSEKYIASPVPDLFADVQEFDSGDSQTTEASH